MEKSVVKEEKVVEEVRSKYLRKLQEKLPALPPRESYLIKTEAKIQMGSSRRKADVALLSTAEPSRFIVIVECKAPGKSRKEKEEGIKQLKSYLAATDTRFGIFAADRSPNKWKYYENQGRNKFSSISRKVFEAQVGLEENAKADKEKEAERRIAQAIEHRARSVKKDLAEQYKQRQTDLEKEKSNLQLNLQMRVDEAHKSGFWKGFKVGFGVCVFAVVVIAIIASGG